MHKTEPKRIVVAGSTARTLQCLESLFRDERYTIAAVVTPIPKIVGRKKDLVINPVHEFAQKNTIPVVLIEKRIDKDVRANMTQISDFDILLVVDFGYWVPKWLLALPKVAPLNIHPSALPAWRGSSPAQYAILYGETQSAVTLMVMDEKLDEGPIINQISFPVPPEYDSTTYYAHAFSLICAQLPDLIENFCIQKKSVAQPLQSPTPTAALLSTQAAFVPWQLVQQAMQGSKLTHEQLDFLSEPLRSACVHHNYYLATTLERASKAFVPWPSLWTTIQTKQGEKRLKLLELSIDAEKKLILQTVQIEGKNPTTYSQITDSIL